MSCISASGFRGRLARFGVTHMQFGRLFSSRKSMRKRYLRQQARSLHADLKARALHPELYVAGIAEDSLNGRFEQVSLHSALIMRHLRDSGDEGRQLAQMLYEEVFSGFDYSLRETGVGDSSISRKVRKLGEHFFGLARGLDAAFAENEPAVLLDFVTRNGLGNSDPARFAAYLRRVNEILLVESSEIISQGSIDWPEVPD